MAADIGRIGGNVTVAIRDSDDRLDRAVGKRNRFVVAVGVKFFQRQILRDIDIAVLLDRDSKGDGAMIVGATSIANSTDDEPRSSIFIQVDIMPVGGLNARIHASRRSLQRIDNGRHAVGAGVDQRNHNWQ